MTREWTIPAAFGLRGDYQPAAVRALLSARRGYVVVPAGGGKTVIAARALQLGLEAVAGERRRVLWIANTREQCDQARAALALWPAELAERTETAVVCWQAGVPRPDSESGAESEEARAAGAQAWHHVVVDECHHAPAPVLAGLLAHLQSARTIWGLTATPDRADGAALEPVMGPELYRVERAALVAAGHLAAARVVWLAPNARGEHVAQIAAEAAPEIEKALARTRWRARDMPPPAYAELCAQTQRRAEWAVAQRIGVVENAARAEAAIEAARRACAGGLLTLALAPRVDMATRFAERLRAAGIEAEAVSGSTAKKKRAAMMDRFREGAIRCLCATQLADEGFDAPRAGALVLASGGRHAGRAEQRTGRVLRAFAEKTEGIIYEFWDWQHPMLEAQSRARDGAYKSLGYAREFAPAILDAWAEDKRAREGRRAARKPQREAFV